jgi:carbon-monoxide dehydrogenase medium subunit
MKRLREFRYHEPETLEEAVEILASEGDGARVLAGGTDLVVDMKTERVLPSAVVNLKTIPDLDGIRAEPGGTRIGALTRVAAIQESDRVRRCYPALADAAGVLASPPVRAMATIGGNVGRASPASDLTPPLIVLGAAATIIGIDGERNEPVEDLFLGPGATTLAPSDILTSVWLPEPPAGSGSAHLKLGGRGSGTDIAVAGVSVAFRLAGDGSVADPGIVLASVAPTPMRAADAEAAIDGRAPDEETWAAAGEAAAAECRPIGDVRASASYRIALVRVLTVRALRRAAAVAQGGMS